MGEYLFAPTNYIALLSVIKTAPHNACLAPCLRAGAVATAVAGYQNVIEEVLLPTVGNDAFLHNVH